MAKVFKTRTSNEELAFLKKSRLLKHDIYSFFPVDKWDCECQGLINDIKNQMTHLRPEDIEDFKKSLGVVRCPKAIRPTYKKYKVKCQNCGEIVAEVFATGPDLKDYCDLHYVGYSEIRKTTIVQKQVVEDKAPAGKTHGPTREVDVEKIIEEGFWQGALTVNISPIDGTLGFECACGVDTRDFRANMTLPSEIRQAKIAITSQGREFGKGNSKFLSVVS